MSYLSQVRLNSKPLQRFQEEKGARASEAGKIKERGQSSP
jgi:hypothetical protein